MSITTLPFGTLSDGRAIEQYTLSHAGLLCRIITYGGIITELHVPDREGKVNDIVLGCPSLAAYEAGHPYFGAITGRVAGRINRGRFELDGVTYPLPLSQPPNHLHGGITGFDKRVWQASPGKTSEGEPSLRMSYHSPDGEEGYPGNLDISVTYTLTNNASLKIDYEAVTDAPTPFNPTNHSYFNLAGEEADQTIADHHIQILADRMVLMADDIGTLEEKVSPVEGTIHDFRQSRSLAEFIAPPLHTHGENYLFEEGKVSEPRLCAIVKHPASGRIMTVSTSESGVQLYTGKFLAESELTGKSGHAYRQHGALCLECQGMPNGVNTPEIDDIVLRPGSTYHQTTVYSFSTE